MIEAILVAAQLCHNCVWVHNFCRDFCDRPSIYGTPNPQIETWNTHTECEQSRTELIDQASKKTREHPHGRWVWSRCIEQPKSGHFDYLEEE